MLLSFQESKELLDKYQIPLLKSAMAGNEEELQSVLDDFDFPVVMKLDAPDMVHKTDKGGVKLGIQDREDATVALKELLNINENGQVVIQPQSEGQEIIIGGKRDDIFGPVIMIGLGGIFVEIYQDIVFRLAPIDKEEAFLMLEDIKGKKILEGFRGHPAVNKEALAEILVRTSELLENEEQIKELDLNPVLVSDTSSVCDVKLIV
ncbi:MAG: acetate--CoA ligase family protein [Candidatus Paceibacterota bacterium]